MSKTEKNVFSGTISKEFYCIFRRDQMDEKVTLITLAFTQIITL